MEKTFQVKEFLKKSFKKTQENYFNFLQIFLVYFVTIIIFQLAVGPTSKELPVLSFVISLVMAFIMVVFSLDLLKYYLALKRNEKVSFSDFFKNFGDIVQDTKLWLNYLGGGLLSGLVIMLGFMIFVVPGVILTFALLPMMLLIVDKNYKILDAFKISFKLTKGYRNKIFLTYLAFFALTVLCLAIPYLILSFTYNFEIIAIILGAIILLVYGFMALFSGILISSIYDFLYENYDEKTSLAKPVETSLTEVEESEETDTTEDSLDDEKEDN